MHSVVYVRRVTFERGDIFSWRHTARVTFAQRNFCKALYFHGNTYEMQNLNNRSITNGASLLHAFSFKHNTY